MAATHLLRSLIAALALLLALPFGLRAQGDQDREEYVVLDAIALFGTPPSIRGSRPIRLPNYLGWGRNADVFVPFAEGAEVYPFFVGGEENGSADRLAVKLREGTSLDDLRVVLLARELQRIESAVPASRARAEVSDAKAAFLAAKALHYHWLWQWGLPGGALFRSEYNAAAALLTAEERGRIEARVPRPLWRQRSRELDYNIFSGGRAIEENLQLDLVLAVEGEVTEGSVPLDSVVGVTVEEIDWEPLLEGVEEPARDALAAHLPQDNVAVFVPSFGALTRLVDESERVGNPIADMLVARGENQHTRGRIEGQLLLSLDAMTRALGSFAIDEVAVCADDPYWRDGTGLALLFRTSQPAVLVAALQQRHEAALAGREGVARREGSNAAGEYHGVANAHRAVSSYIQQLNAKTVVVANSEQLLARIAETTAETSLAALDEYTFFRARYPKGAANEDALILLTDAAIRKWTGPKWRIGQSRRIRAAAAMADLAMEHRDQLLGITGGPASVSTAWVFTGPTEVMLESHGPRHEQYGTLDFLTPIAELDFDTCTENEAAAYTTFRNRYQNRWRQFFDPIAVRIGLEEGLDLDVTVMPLIAGSDYRELIELTGNGALAADAGDPHDSSLLHIIWHLNPESRTVKDANNMLGSTMPGLSAPLAWIGDTFEFYIDDADLFEGIGELNSSGEMNMWMSENWFRLPVAARVAVKNPLGLAAFLSGLKTMADSFSPGLTTWTTHEHSERKYVEIAAAGGGNFSFSIFYLTEPRSLTVSLQSSVIHAAIDRSLAREADAEPSTAKPWLGTSTAATAHPKAIHLWRRLLGTVMEDRVRDASYGNLPILSEWRQRYPDRDPVEVHKSLLGVTLECPAGGEYVWNEEWHTMESTVLGHRFDQRGTVALPAVLTEFGRLRGGLTFENDGLRARFIGEKPVEEPAE